MVLSVRERLDLALPVIRASSSREPGAFSAMTRSNSRLPADKTLAKDSVEVNHTLGSFGATRRSPRTTARRGNANVGTTAPFSIADRWQTIQRDSRLQSH